MTNFVSDTTSGVRMLPSDTNSNNLMIVTDASKFLRVDLCICG